MPGGSLDSWTVHATEWRGDAVPARGKPKAQDSHKRCEKLGWTLAPNQVQLGKSQCEIYVGWWT